MSRSTFYPLTLLLLLLLSLTTQVLSHGLMAIPNQRGTLDREKFNQNAPEIDPDAETDFYPHFPAGDKCTVPGCGKRSQERAAGSAGWTPFKPLDPNFKWRADVCGDELGNPEHRKGGRYYNDGQIVATYNQAGKISVAINMIAHHNGFMELHICDMNKCENGDISAKCFRDGHCKQLMRSKNPTCDSGLSKKCAPIDPNYPGRWYFPCSKYSDGEGLEIFGGDDNTILYDLPENLVCDHCVLQWFWSTANGCNPPGVVEFFDSENAPKNWGQCPGQGGALGGVTRVQRPCGKGDDGEMRFPEEYLQCADVRIESSGSRQGPRPDDDPADEKEDIEEDSAPEPVAPSPTPAPSETPAPSKIPAPSKAPAPSKTPKPSPVSAAQIAPTQTPEPTVIPEYSLEPSPEMSMEPSPEMSMEFSPEMSMEPSPEMSMEGSPEYMAPTIDDRTGTSPMTRTGLISDIRLYADGGTVRSIYDGDEIDVSAYEGFSIEAVTRREVRSVEFIIDGELVNVEYREPYFLSRNSGDKVHYWNNPIVNKEFTLVTRAEDAVDEVTIKLIKE